MTSLLTRSFFDATVRQLTFIRKNDLEVDSAVRESELRSINEDFLMSSSVSCVVHALPYPWRSARNPFTKLVHFIVYDFNRSSVESFQDTWAEDVCQNYSPMSSYSIKRDVSMYRTFDRRSFLCLTSLSDVRCAQNT